MKTMSIILAVVVGLAVIAFNLGRGFLALISMTYWSTGDRPRPMLDALAIAGLAVSILLVAGATTALIQGVRERSPILLLIFGVVMTVVSAGLLVVHVAEADVTRDGFRQPRYRVSVTQDLTFYNTTAAPVTICIGVRSTCDGRPGGPSVLNGAGLTLAPGEARSVEFPADGRFPVTIASPAGLAQADAMVAVDAAPDSGGGADLPY